MLDVVSRDQRRRAAAGTAAEQGCSRGFGKARIGSESEVIIAAEIDTGPAFDRDRDTMCAVDAPPHAIQVFAAQPFQFARQPDFQHGRPGRGGVHPSQQDIWKLRTSAWVAPRSWSST